MIFYLIQFYRRFLLLIMLIFYSIQGVCQAFSANIHVDQFGYILSDAKVAVISNPMVGYNAMTSFTPGETYQVVNAANNNVVFFDNIVPWNNGLIDDSSGDQIWHFDFSSVNEAGTYYIYDVENNLRSDYFNIGNDVYNDILKQCVRALYYQRCGIAKALPYAEVPWIDVPCHNGALQDNHCRFISSPNNSSLEKDLSGGWHDAGDYNKYVNFTLDPVHDLLDAYEQKPSLWTDDYDIPESNNGVPDLLDEVKYELNWLLKMQEVNGAVLTKVSVSEFQSASPPSMDNAQRFYGEAVSSSTRVLCGIMAHAAIVFNQVGETSFADSLKSSALLAWQWLESNTGYSDYDNQGFSSANPEVSHYDQDALSVVASSYLFALTGQVEYKTYFDTHYANVHAIDWGFWYPFESTYQNSLLYYADLASANSVVASNIINSFQGSVLNDNPELLSAYQAGIDPYNAYLTSENYTWGSNKVKSNTATLYQNMLYYNIAPDNSEDYAFAALGYLHYINGVNPQNLVYLSNMNNFGAINSCNEIYHLWFADNTDFDNAQTSLYGPAPGYIPGGPNKYFDPSSNAIISPPENQPDQKSYKDWNTSYPEDSWEITEPANDYQGAFIKMLSKFCEANTSVSTKFIKSKNSISIVPNPSKGGYFEVLNQDGFETVIISILSADGQLISVTTIKDNSVKSTVDLLPGIYWVKLEFDEKVITKKLIVY